MVISEYLHNYNSSDENMSYKLIPNFYNVSKNTFTVFSSFVVVDISNVKVQFLGNEMIFCLFVILR